MMICNKNKKHCDFLIFEYIYKCSISYRKPSFDEHAMRKVEIMKVCSFNLKMPRRFYIKIKAREAYLSIGFFLHTRTSINLVLVLPWESTGEYRNILGDGKLNNLYFNPNHDLCRPL
jgi:hypothetical protein